MEISVNQSIAYALLMKQANRVSQFQTAVFNKAVDSFEIQAEEITALVSEVSEQSIDMEHLIDILI